MCVVGSVAAVTEQQDLFMVVAATDWARGRNLVIEVFAIVVENRLCVELGDLLLVLDGICG